MSSGTGSRAVGDVYVCLCACASRSPRLNSYVGKIALLLMSLRGAVVSYTSKNLILLL